MDDADIAKYTRRIERERAARAEAERLLELYNGEWQGDLTRLYRDFAY